MKKQIAKTITILSLFITLSVSASNVSAFPSGDPWITDSGYRTQSSVSASNVPAGTGCNTCKPQAQYALSASTQNATQTPDRDSDGQETAFATQPEYSFNFAFFLAQLAMSFLSLP